MESYTIIDNDIWKDHNIKGYEKVSNIDIPL